ncbi:helix-turn-helix domain-containing protein [Saccharothrix sp. Mg75]|uniref:helix-turn-helix domain-containing protein n=1 Tax=Saccharothrix sp. Mg75 TaxID=3445357 RepID=UPI003EEB1A24
MNFEDNGVAARVIEARKIAGLTQVQLATRANVSLSLIKKVERGAMPASPMFIASVARALGLLVTDLTDSRNFDSLQGSYGLERRFVPDLERAIIEGNNTLLDGPLHSLPSLSLTLKRVITGGRVSRYSDILEVLPDLIRHLSVHSITAASDQLELANRLLAQAYYSAMFASYKFGHLSLSAWAAERMSMTANKSGDPLWAAMGHYSRSQALMFSGSYRASQLMLDRVEADLADEKDARKIEVLGAAHLAGSIIAARLDKSTLSDAHLQEARDLARHVDTTGDQFDTAFSAANVEIHAVAAAVESSEPSVALKRGAGLNLTGKLYPSRIGHYHIDLARAYFMQGDHENVIRELQLARQISPQQARYHPQVHELIRALARTRRRSDPVARLGAWAGLK